MHTAAVVLSQTKFRLANVISSPIILHQFHTILCPSRSTSIMKRSTLQSHSEIVQRCFTNYVHKTRKQFVIKETDEKCREALKEES